MATRTAERTLDVELFGREISVGYSRTWHGYSLLSLRLVMAWVFLQAGLGKLAENGWTEPLAWSSASFLEHAVDPANPLDGLFGWFANHTAVVDPLVIVGQILIGAALLFGVVLRFAALMGGIQMLFFWMAAWEGGPMAGIPVENGYVVNATLVYLLVLLGLAVWGAGRIIGVDGALERTDTVENNPWLRYLLG